MPVETYCGWGICCQLYWTEPPPPSFVTPLEEEGRGVDLGTVYPLALCGDLKSLCIALCKLRRYWGNAQWQPIPSPLPDSRTFVSALQHREMPEVVYMYGTPRTVLFPLNSSLGLGVAACDIQGVQVKS